MRMADNRYWYVRIEKIDRRIDRMYYTMIAFTLLNIALNPYLEAAVVRLLTLFVHV